MHRCTERTQHAFPAGCIAEGADAEHGGKVSSRRMRKGTQIRRRAKAKQAQSKGNSRRRKKDM